MKIARLNGKPEIFYTIQGEGKNLGQPSIFIRCSLCNLHCIWCDTDYTWNWQGTSFKHNRDNKPEYKKFIKEEQIIEVSPEEIVEEVIKYPCKNIVFTGGEPLLQQDGWIAIMQILRQIDSSYWFEVETNNTIIAKPEFDRSIHQYNISPKTEASSNKITLRENPDVYEYYANNPKSVFKYVVVDKQDMDEIVELVNKYKLNPNSVYIVAEGVTSEELKMKSVWLIDECKEHNFHFTDRLHIHVYGHKRGV